MSSNDRHLSFVKFLIDRDRICRTFDDDVDRALFKEIMMKLKNRTCLNVLEVSVMHYYIRKNNIGEK